MTANESFGFLRLSSSVRADVTGASLAEFAKEMDRIQNRDITVAEAGKAQQQVRTSNVTGYGSLSEIVGTVLGLQAQGSSQAKQDALLAGLSKLSADALNEIAQKMYDRRQSLIVLVGDKKAILEQIKGLDLPTPEFVNP